MLGLTLPIYGQERQTEEKIPWQSLSPPVQELLQDAETRWDELPAERQQSLLRGAERWQSMQTEERENARQQQQRFQNLPPQQREQIVRRFQRFNQLSRDQQLRLRSIQQRFRNLPPARRRALRRRFESQFQQLQEEQRIQQDAMEEIRQSRQRVRGLLDESQSQARTDNDDATRNPRRLPQRRRERDASGNLQQEQQGAQPEE
jgi:hypothetical protein